MDPPVTHAGQPYPPDADRRARWEAELWEGLDRVRREWVSSAEHTGRARDIAIARVLTALWLDGTRRQDSAIRSLSERARDYLDPTDVGFSEQVRGAKVRRALEYLVQAFQADADTNPAATLAAVSIVPAAAREAGDAPARNRRYRHPERVRARYLPATVPTADDLWTDALPVTVTQHGLWLLPPTQPVAGNEVSTFVVAELEAARARPFEERASALLDAVTRIKHRLRSDSSRAPTEVLAYIGFAAVEAKRPAIDRLQANAWASAERLKARALLRFVLGAWGVSDDDVENLLRFDTKNPRPDPERGQRLVPTLHALPLDEPEAAARWLRGAWAQWKVGAHDLGDESLLRVAAVFDALLAAWTTGDDASMEALGRCALDAMPVNDTPELLRAPTIKALAMRSKVALVLAAVYERATVEGVVEAPSVVRRHLPTWAATAADCLASNVRRYFPWLRCDAGEAMRKRIERGIKKDMRTIRQMMERDVRREVVLDQAQDLTIERAERVIGAEFRAAGMTTGAVHNLFPRR